MDSERQMSGTPLYKNVIASCALALGTVFCAWAQPQPLDLNGSWEFAFAKGTTTVDEAKAGENPSGLKLTYKAKDGTFKGSFKAYADVGGKPKAT